MNKLWGVPLRALIVVALLAGCGANASTIPTSQPTTASATESAASTTESTASTTESAVSDATAESTAQSSTSNTSSAAAAGPDADSDGIPDNAETLLATDPNNDDTDGDGRNDRDDDNPIFADNPIVETSTTEGFSINSILVEDNVDANNRAAPDHLELSITNTTDTDLTDFDIYYTFADPTTNHTEAYYLKLSDFTLGAGETTSIHFDSADQPAHFPFNPNSIYFNNPNELPTEVTLHAAGYAPQTATVTKDAIGEELQD
jgi:hypothetical protein